MPLYKYWRSSVHTDMALSTQTLKTPPRRTQSRTNHNTDPPQSHTARGRLFEPMTFLALLRAHNTQQHNKREKEGIQLSFFLSFSLSLFSLSAFPHILPPHCHPLLSFVLYGVDDEGWVSGGVYQGGGGRERQRDSGKREIAGLRDSERLRQRESDGERERLAPANNPLLQHTRGFIFPN